MKVQNRMFPLTSGCTLSHAAKPVFEPRQELSACQAINITLPSPVTFEGKVPVQRIYYAKVIQYSMEPFAVMVVCFP